MGARQPIDREWQKQQEIEAAAHAKNEAWIAAHQQPKEASSQATRDSAVWKLLGWKALKDMFGEDNARMMKDEAEKKARADGDLN
jgi:hypothetical protein